MATPFLTNIFGRGFGSKLILGLVGIIGTIFGGVFRQAPSAGPSPLSIILYVVLGVVILKIIRSI